MTITHWGRRDFIRLSARAAGALSLGKAANSLGEQPGQLNLTQPSDAPSESPHSFNGTYEGTRLGQIAFPMGGMGAGMICLEGTGALSKFSLRHRPDLTNEPKVFAAVSIKGLQKTARVLEGPVPAWKLRPQFSGGEFGEPPIACWGLPRFHEATFEARFPFAAVRLKAEEMPLEVELTGWSPFTPGDADNASLPVASVEYRFINRTQVPVDAVFSFNAENFISEPPQGWVALDTEAQDRIRPTSGGFILYGPGADDRPWDEGCWAAWVDDPNVKVNHAWFRVGAVPSFSLPIVWRDIASDACHEREPWTEGSSPGASLFVPFAIAPGQAKTITLQLAWYFPQSNLYEPKERLNDGKRTPFPPPPETYRPWYAGLFSSIDEVIKYWRSQYRPLKQATEKFTQAFYDSTLPPEVIEAVAANLTILKSPTVLRQTDGRFWEWEGSNDLVGSCYGSCTHVWNYAQAIAHLFPDVERSMRETEFGPGGGDEAGLVLCTLPRGGAPSLPFDFSAEVWTGTEYHVASHLIALGMVGLHIIRACRCRYDGRIRNPIDELEAGHWYARALSLYALLQAFSGARYDAVDKILYLRSAIKGDFRCFLSTATGYGTVGVKNGQPLVEVVSGDIPYAKIKYVAA
jgi:uncharacterized protein (DUF608 family)